MRISIYMFSSMVEDNKDLYKFKIAIYNTRFESVYFNIIRMRDVSTILNKLDKELIYIYHMYRLT